MFADAENLVIRGEIVLNDFDIFLFAGRGDMAVGNAILHWALCRKVARASVPQLVYMKA